ncbi:MAG: hypothetical protein CMH56_16905 [Myxococcales bacterium]|nr:hypothetical protein [Myxococcales bacterium]
MLDHFRNSWDALLSIRQGVKGLSEKTEHPEEKVLIYHPSKVSWGTAQFIAKPPNVAARAFIYLLLFSLFSGLTYAYFAEIPISTESRGTLVTAKPPMPVVTPVELKVKSLLVEEGQKVRKGDTLLVPEAVLSDTDYDNLLVDTESLQKILKKDFSTCTSCPQQVQNLIDEGFEVSGTGSIMESVAPTIQLMRNLITSYAQVKQLPMTTKSLRRRINTARSKLNQIKARGAAQALAIQVEQLRGEIASADAALNEKTLRVNSEVAQTKSRLQSQVESLKVVLEQTRNRSLFEAPIDGMVSKLKISGPGQYIRPGDTLMELVPLNSPLIAELLVSNQNIASIKSGMEARIKLDAFPERDYGVLNGEVAEIPKTAIQRPGPQGAIISGYLVRLGLEKQAFKRGDKDYPFRLGMTLTGLVVTRYESILSVGVRKLLNIKDEMVGY